MEYFGIFKNKFSTAVVDTVYMAESITKNVLPGNPVTREYEVSASFNSQKDIDLNNLKTMRQKSKTKILFFEFIIYKL